MSLTLKYTGKLLSSLLERDVKGQSFYPYIPSDELIEVVNHAIYLRRPLLIKGEPGCGKSSLAHAVAYELGLPYEFWYVKSTSRAQDGLYNYDAVGRLHDAQLAAHLPTKQLSSNPNEVERYIQLGPLGRSIQNEQRTVLLIDDIDRADIDFPNDLLQVLDMMRLDIDETRDRFQAKEGAEPIIFITSNDEKPLPEAFLRRCLFHYINFPSAEQLKMIVDTHFQLLSTPELINAAVEYYLNLRKLEVGRKLSIRSLLDHFRLLLLDSPDEALAKISRENSNLLIQLDLSGKIQDTGSKSEIKASNAVEVFYSYSHKDGKLRDKLETQLSLLKREGFIKSWYDRNISAGVEWSKEIDMHLTSAHIILLLVSPDFIASDYCYGIEMMKALERHEHEEARVIPIILRPTDWNTAPFGKLAALPRDGKAVTIWNNRDQAFLDVAKGIRKVIQELTQIQ